jgi:glyoxylase-like metal-dependent hydrolase (beta-lactamase superfamily II)
VIVASATVGPLQENAWLLVDEASRDAVLIDPGDEPSTLVRLLEAHAARVTAIWLTHAHVDHVGAVGPLVARFGVPVALHAADRVLYDRAPEIGHLYGMRIPPLPAPSIDLADGMTLALGAHRFAVIHLPGHSPGQVAFMGDGVAFAGDVLFAGSIGRTDLPLSDPRAMRESLGSVASWPAATVVHPGHGPSTTIARELADNPFLSGLARPVGS